MYFSDYKAHSAPLFVNSGILPIKLLYFKSVASLLHDIANLRAPPNISELFTRSAQIHSYSTRSSSSGKLSYKNVENKSTVIFLIFRIGANIWNDIPLKVRELEKAPFKRKLKHILLQILQTGERRIFEFKSLGKSKNWSFAIESASVIL